MDLSKNRPSPYYFDLPRVCNENVHIRSNLLKNYTQSTFKVKILYKINWLVRLNLKGYTWNPFEKLGSLKGGFLWNWVNFLFLTKMKTLLFHKYERGKEGWFVLFLEFTKYMHICVFLRIPPLFSAYSLTRVLRSIWYPHFTSPKERGSIFGVNLDF